MGRKTGVMGAQCPQHLKITQFSVTVFLWVKQGSWLSLFWVFFFLPFRVRHAGGVSCFAMLIS